MKTWECRWKALSPDPVTRSSSSNTNMNPQLVLFMSFSCHSNSAEPSNAQQILPPPFHTCEEHGRTAPVSGPPVLNRSPPTTQSTCSCARSARTGRGKVAPPVRERKPEKHSASLSSQRSASTRQHLSFQKGSFPSSHVVSLPTSSRHHPFRSGTSFLYFLSSLLHAIPSRLTLWFDRFSTPFGVEPQGVGHRVQGPGHQASTEQIPREDFHRSGGDLWVAGRQAV